ncbi:glycosyltransferase family 39 protein [Patescibacteria group bacterium]|nr:glycosyltransferase family 39 protein [Patescibacteria group bacterium]MCG2702071.1 hypothetical protein [Candidatus Parcubacteria bacterium]MBU4265145.1 glycosyltransferase family 39 protein [Patescibacteria group bacterium]MBU4390709.1 glycosyltransferase family 39 protein [Patescibacteria group bacterium]MBU4431117.1 glycosyltransferase family 39 protein [Patescibacteria group bacterium]
MKCFFKKKFLLPYIFILTISFLTCFRLFRSGYFSMQDDVHIFRLQQFDQCIKDLQIPCRFISNGGFGYGYPLFNFYPPFVYIIAETFHLFGLSLINSIKLTFVLGHLSAGIGIFLFSKLFWGQKGALLSTILYLFAPYRAVDGYVRGALAEFFALSLLPFVFWSITKYLQKSSKKNLLVSTILLSSLFLCHNLISLVTIPILILYIFFYQKQIRFKLFLPIFLSLGLSSFFIIPALLEKKLVTIQTMTQGYFNYEAHFTTLKQLFFSHDWGFGASLWGPIDDMSFQIGYIHWLVPLICFILFLLKTNKKPIKNIPILIFFALLSLISLFLTHPRSIFIWKLFPFMAYFQFPWRFLGIAIFSLSFISASLISLIPKNQRQLWLILISTATIILNIKYFKEDIWYSNLTDKDKLNKQEIIRQSGAGLKDYWPNSGNQFPPEFAPPKPFSLDKITLNSFNKTSNRADISITVDSEFATITFPMVYFPNWQIYNQNNQKLPITITPDLGLIQLKLPKGDHTLTLKLKNTPIRTVANTISIITLLTLLVILNPISRTKDLLTNR